MNPNYLDFEQPIADLEAKIEALRLLGNDNDLNISDEIATLHDKSVNLTGSIFSKLSAAQVSKVARHPLRRNACQLWIHPMHGQLLVCSYLVVSEWCASVIRPVILSNH